MPLGPSSLLHLSTCRPELQDLIMQAAAGIDRGDLAYAGINDMAVTCGRRDRADQEKAFRAGTSQLHWPDSKHNVKPTDPDDTLVDAADVVPYPEKWSDAAKLKALHAYIVGLARGMGISLRSISWDMPHIEFKE